MKSGFSWSSVLIGAEIRWPQGRVGAGSQSCPVEEEKDGVEESDHSCLFWMNPCNNSYSIGILFAWMCIDNSQV